MISTVASTMIEMPWLGHISACWSSSNCIYDSEPTVLPSLAHSSSCSSSVTMIKRRSKRSHSSRPANQLLKPVSPFEELLMSDERYPFDEGVLDERHDAPEKRDTRVFPDARDQRTFRDDSNGCIPKYVLVPNGGRDDDSEVTLDERLFHDEERTLTPHPSFDEPDNKPTACDFHYLYNVSLQVDEQDWPSDEDRSPKKQSGCTFWTNGPVRKRNLGHDVMMIMKDVDDGVSKRPSHQSKYRLV